MNNIVEIGVSPKQISKLRNGHKVRVKKAVSGNGICMIVNPSKYDIITRAFSRGKGAEISLSPEEIMDNLNASSNMEGKGIFGKKFDKAVEKTIGKKAKNIVYKGAAMLKPAINKGIDKIADYAPEIGASAFTAAALAAGQPELVPVAAVVGSKLGKMAGKKSASAVKDYIDKPTYYQEKIGIGGSGVKKRISSKMIDTINKTQGTNMGYMERAGLGNAQALVESASMMKPYVRPMGEGLYAGQGLYAANARGSGMCIMCNRNSKDLIAGKGVRVLPQALLSQPYSANFQFRSTMPPAYQMIGKGHCS